MLNEHELIAALQARLDRAKENRDMISKRTKSNLDRRHLDYANGVADGVESAIVGVIAILHKQTVEQAVADVSSSPEFICERCYLRQDAKPAVEPGF